MPLVGCELLLGDIPRKKPTQPDAGDPERDAESDRNDGESDDGDLEPDDAQQDDADESDADGEDDRDADAAAQGSESDSGSARDTAVEQPDPDDCDGASEQVFYLDRDEDGYGDDATRAIACREPSGAPWIQIGGDCNDERDEVHPGQTEFFGTGYRVPDSERVSFDYDCNGVEVSAPFQDLAPNCARLALGDLGCSGRGYIENSARATAPGTNVYCGSNEQLFCVSGLLECTGQPSTIDVHFACR